MPSPKRQPKIIKTVLKTSDKTNSLSSLKNKLAVCDLEVQNYVRALEKKNLKLVEQVGKLQADNMTLNNRIKSLLNQIKEKGPSLTELLLQVDNKSRSHDLTSKS